MGVAFAQDISDCNNSEEKATPDYYNLEVRPTEEICNRLDEDASVFGMSFVDT